MGPDFYGTGQPYGLFVDAHYYSPGWQADLRTWNQVLPDGKTQVYSSVLHDGWAVCAVFNGVYKRYFDVRRHAEAQGSSIDQWIADETASAPRPHVLPTKASGRLDRHHGGLRRGPVAEKIGDNHVTIDHEPLSLTRARQTITWDGVRRPHVHVRAHPQRRQNTHVRRAGRDGQRARLRPRAVHQPALHRRRRLEDQGPRVPARRRPDHRASSGRPSRATCSPTCSSVSWTGRLPNEHARRSGRDVVVDHRRHARDRPGPRRRVARARLPAWRSADAPQASSTTRSSTLSEGDRGDRVLGVVADVDQPRRHAGRCGTTPSPRFGRVDIWINNAGISLPRTPLRRGPRRQHRHRARRHQPASVSSTARPSRCKGMTRPGLRLHLEHGGLRLRRAEGRRDGVYGSPSAPSPTSPSRW